MAERRYCARCGKDVVCKEEREQMSGTGRTMVRLSCPGCAKQFGVLYGSKGVRPVRGVKISRG